MSDIVITSAVRTAGGRFGGAFKKVSAVELGALVLKEAVRRSGVDPGEVDEVVFGTGWQTGKIQTWRVPHLPRCSPLVPYFRDNGCHAARLLHRRPSGLHSRPPCRDPAV